MKWKIADHTCKHQCTFLSVNYILNVIVIRIPKIILCMYVGFEGLEETEI